METALVIDNYDWSKCKKMVNIGGSYGAVAVELTRRFPDIECTVQDLPEMIAGVTEKPDRVAFQSHEFFTEQPLTSTSSA